MPPKGVPKTTSTGPFSGTVEQTTVFTATVNIQGLKVEFLVFEGVAQLVASCKGQKMARPYMLGRPLGFT